MSLYDKDGFFNWNITTKKQIKKHLKRQINNNLRRSFRIFNINPSEAEFKAVKNKLLKDVYNIQ